MPGRRGEEARRPYEQNRRHRRAGVVVALAFIEEVSKRDAGVTAEYAKLGGTRMDEPCPYRLA